MENDYRPDFDHYKILRVNLETLNQVSALIDQYQQTDQAVKSIILSANAWDSLERNVLSKSAGKQSLITHNYKQFQLVKGPV